MSEIIDPEIVKFMMDQSHEEALDEDRERAKTPKQRVLERIEAIKKEVEDHACDEGLYVDWAALVKAVEAL